MTGPLRPGPGGWLLLAAAALGVALLLYGPALRGEFLSDDLHYVRANPYVHQLDWESVAVLFDPSGPATLAVVNYAPVQLLLHSAMWQLSGPDPLGHHLLNVVLHALASLLLAALLLAQGIPAAGALLGGLLFLVHPANVEAVAWISQLKSSLALTLALGALLAHPRRPALGALLFGLALLAKPTAAFALPVAALLDAFRVGRLRWAWLGLWALLLVAFAGMEFSTHQRSGAAEATLHETPLVLLRTMAALAARYALLAATSVGSSAFHEPEPARSWLDPWWLASLPLLALLGWRSFAALRGRRSEAAWWLWAAVSFAPVSQLFPFLYPMADRYLYFILPGLLGGALLAFESLRARQAPARAAQWARVGLALGLLLAGVFALRAHERAHIWRSNALVVADAAANYPDGKVAHVLRAKRAARAGEAGQALESLRAAAARGYNRFEQLEIDPAYAELREHPEFRAVVEQMAAGWIESGRRKPNPTQLELRAIAHAHLARREYEAARSALERALERGGPRQADIRSELAALDRALELGAPERLRLGTLNAPF